MDVILRIYLKNEMRFEFSINILLLKASEIKPGKDLLFSKKKSE